jgi:hypothetical protein
VENLMPLLPHAQPWFRNADLWLGVLTFPMM